MIPHDSSQDPFFSGWLDRHEHTAEFLERGDEREPLTGDPRVGVTVSAVLHVLLVVFLLVEPSFGLLGAESDAQETAEAERNPLLMFFEEPPPAEVVAVPVVPVEPVEPDAAPEDPPQVAEDRLLIPKAMLAPPEDKVQEFMNDLPFSEGNTDEFYTSEEVKDPGTEGEDEAEEAKEPELVARETGEDDAFRESAEGEDNGNGGSEAERPAIGAEDLGDFLFGQPGMRDQLRPRADIPPPDPRRRIPDQIGEGGEDGRFTDIRRFLADAQFHNPEGGLVSNTNNTLYYNDKGANFVPWIARLIAEVKRNWFVPQNIAWDHGHIAVRISVDRGGNLLAMEVLVPSGVPSFDAAATGAIRGSRLMPLPADYPDERFEIILVFWYNERPYDLFG